MQSIELHQEVGPYTCYLSIDLGGGRFDERFRRPGGDDTRLGLDVTAAGVEAVLAEDAVVYHDVRPGGLHDPAREALQ
jgi:hypothetical protein